MSAVGVVEEFLAQCSRVVLGLHQSLVLEHGHHVVEEVVIALRHQSIHDLDAVDARGLVVEEPGGDGLG